MTIGAALYYVLTIILVCLIFYRPRFAFTAFICMGTLDIWAFIYVPIMRTNTALSNLIIMIPICISCFYHYRGTILKGGFQYIKIRMFIFILFAYAFISLLWTPNDVPGYSMWVNPLVYIFVGIFILPLCMKDSDSFSMAIKAIAIIGTVLMLALVFIPKWANRALYIEGMNDSVGLPLTIAQLAGYVLIYALFNINKQFYTWAIFLCGTIGALMVAIKTGSRGPLIFSLLCTMVFLPKVFGGGVIKKFAVLGLFGFIMGYVVLEIFTSTEMNNTNRWHVEELSGDAEGRLGAGLFLVGEAFKNPATMLFGLGNSAAFSSHYLGIYPHIVPLEVLAEEGVIGFLLWLAIICWTLLKINVVKNKKIVQTTEDRKVFYALYASFLFVLLLSLKQGSLISFSMPFVFAALIERYVALKVNENYT